MTPPPTTPRPAHTTVVVRGATLAGIAAALRLAKAGHRVVLDAAGVGFAGHWGEHGEIPDELPQTFSLRAAWMDLFKKSGRAFDAEMTRAGLALTPAPATRHVFADGSTLDLPAERGAQFHAVETTLGHAAAARWSELLDRADDVWMALRMHGLERPAPASFDRATRQALWASRTLDDLARDLREPHLAAIVRSLGPLSGAPDAGAPALLITRAVIERQFGRWQVVDAEGHPQPAGRLLDLLRERLITRRVELIGFQTSAAPRSTASTQDAADLPATPDAVVEARPLPAEGWLNARRVSAALAPTVRHTIVAAPPHLPRTGIGHVVDHRGDRPVVRWIRPLGDGRAAVVEHDHTTANPDLAWGLSPSSWSAMAHRPTLRDPRTPTIWRASASSFAGGEPWAELLSAALAVYELHEQLTGADIRPTNRDAGRPRRSPGRAAARAEG